MKSFVIICAALLFIEVMVGLEDFKEDADWCIERHNLNSQEIYRIHRSYQLPTNNSNYSIFFECLWRKIGFLDAYGEINRKEIWELYYRVAREVYNQEVSRKKANATLEKCKDVTGETPVLRALNMENCLKNVN